MQRFFYSCSISEFISNDYNSILGFLTEGSTHEIVLTQRLAWQTQIEILKTSLPNLKGRIYFEYSIPRMGKRIDVVLLINNIVFVVEFKVGASTFNQKDLDQVYDYALDLKNFHETSHKAKMVPILLITGTNKNTNNDIIEMHGDGLFKPIRLVPSELCDQITKVLKANEFEAEIESWEGGRYSPTPTIIEAAISLFNNHSVSEISRSDASAKNLRVTSSSLSKIIDESKKNGQKSICFVTGVPGSGKTLVGLDIATKYLNETSEITSVYLSGNGPLVSILREALARDRVKREKERGNRVTKEEAKRVVKSFIQNVHHYRDDCLTNLEQAPTDHIAIFDEAQRAWNLEQTSKFMRQKRNLADFTHSEPEFLISCLDRHKDWAVIICLVGGGQEINTGESGIGEWIDAIYRSFPNWAVYISNRLNDSEYKARHDINKLMNRQAPNLLDELHLSVSMRSYRAENVSTLVKCILDIEKENAQAFLSLLKEKYPIILTRKLDRAKAWLKEQSRGTERIGLVVSSQAQRLKPLAIDIRSPIDPVNWFLNEKEDTRSSYYLEDAATEFHIQGLELDWVCVTWDGDLRYSNEGWKTYEFRGSKWQRIIKEERQRYLKNAYRVLLTRARQGMIIVVPDGCKDDPTRLPEFYDETYFYLSSLGFENV